MYREPEESPDFVRITDMLSNLFYQINDWAHAAPKHKVLESEIRYAINNMDIATGKVDEETAVRAAAGLLWAVLQSHENKTIMKN